MVLLTEIKRFFQETTLHGWRYIVDSEHLLTRLLWVLAIAGSFTFAGFMVASNLKETAENPISTSIDTIPVQDLPFPAVTLANYLKSKAHHTLYRFIENVYNQFEFDCIFGLQGEAMHNSPQAQSCMKDTEGLRDDLEPVITFAMKSKYEEAKAVFLNLCKNEPFTMAHSPYLCNLSEEWIDVIEDYGIAYEASDDAQKLEDNTLTALAGVLRGPLDVVMNSIEGVVGSESLRDQFVAQGTNLCTNKTTTNFDIETISAMHALLVSIGHTDVDRELRLGSLIKYAAGLGFDLSNIDSYKQNQQRALTNMQKLYDFAMTGTWNDGEMVWQSKSLAADTFMDDAMNQMSSAGTACGSEEGLLPCRIFGEDNQQSTEMVYRVLKYKQQASQRTVQEKQETGDLVKAVEHIGYKLKPTSPLKHQSTKVETSDARDGAPEQHNVDSEEQDVDPEPDQKPPRNREDNGGEGGAATKQKPPPPTHEIDREERSYVSNTEPMVATCKFQSPVFEPTCKLFSKMPSHNGIGYTFNNEAISNLYKDTPTNAAFFDAMSHSGNGRNEGPSKIDAHGQSYSMQFFVQTQGSPSLAIHNPKSIVDFNEEQPLVLQAGKTYNIAVTPSRIVTDESGLELDQAQRECKTYTENEDSKIFNYYTQSACLFECSLRDRSVCGCIPWDFPRLNTSFPVCTHEETACYHSPQFEPGKFIQECNCPNDCESISYSYSMEVLDTDEICTQDQATEHNQKPFVDSYGVDKFWENEFFTMHILKNGEFYPDIILEEKCRQVQREEVAIVNVYIKPKFATQIVRSRRVTFSSQLANLGGIIGLFTGMSILSVVETLYWLLMMIRRVIVAATVTSTAAKKKDQKPKPKNVLFEGTDQFVYSP